MSMKRYFRLFLKSKILFPVFITALIINATLFIGLPYLFEKRVTNTVTRYSINAINQIKLVRLYYMTAVVEDLNKFAPNISLDSSHWGIDGKVPLPSAMVHDLSTIFNENSGIRFNVYSEYPFKNRKDRLLTPSQKEAIKYTQQNPEGMYIKKDVIDGKRVLRVAMADFMTMQTCVDCHNSHPDRTWEAGKWKLGDKKEVC